MTNKFYAIVPQRLIHASFIVNAIARLLVVAYCFFACLVVVRAYLVRINEILFCCYVVLPAAVTICCQLRRSILITSQQSL
jgi:hypothetical protein